MSANNRNYLLLNQEVIRGSNLHKYLAPGTEWWIIQPFSPGWYPHLSWPGTRDMTLCPCQASSPPPPPQLTPPTTSSAPQPGWLLSELCTSFTGPSVWNEKQRWSGNLFCFHDCYKRLRGTSTVEICWLMWQRFRVRIRYLPHWSWCAAGSLCTNVENLRLQRETYPWRKKMKRKNRYISLLKQIERHSKQNVHHYSTTKSLPN